MSDKSLAIQIASKSAYDRLNKKYFKTPVEVTSKTNEGKIQILPKFGKNGAPEFTYVYNKWHVTPNNITSPSKLIQEQPLNGSTNVLQFDFSQTAPKPSATLNNINLGINDVFVIWGIQVLFGVGATGVSRQYFTHGLLASDNALYQGANMSIQFEQSQNVKSIDMIDFKYDQGTDFKPDEAVVLEQPLRILTGKLGTFLISINMQAVTGLVFTANSFVSVRLCGVLGQAQG